MHGPPAARRRNQRRGPNREASLRPSPRLGRPRPADRADVRGVRESLGDEPLLRVAAGRGARGRASTRLHPVWGSDRSQRHLLLRLGPQVQAMPRPLTGGSPDRPAGDPRSRSSRDRRAADRRDRGRLRRLPDLGSRQLRRAPPGRGGRRPRGGPVRRAAVAGIRRPARPRRRPVPDRRLRSPRGHRRQGRGDRTTEAAVARDYALERGVPDDRILVEDRGRTTLESLRASGRSCRARGSTTPSSCRTAPTCCASSGSPPTSASLPGVRPRRPARPYRDRIPAGRCVRPRARRPGLYFLRLGASPRRRAVGVAPNRGSRSPVSPLGRRSCPGILGQVLRSDRPEGPLPSTASSTPRPFPCPAERGTREAGRGSVVHRSDRLRA